MASSGKDNKSNKSSKSTKKNNGNFFTKNHIILIAFTIILAVAGISVFTTGPKNIQDKTKKETTTKSNYEEKQPDPEPDLNAGYFVVQEWGLRFKVPSGLEDIRYSISGDTLAFYGKPAGSNVQYVADYDKFEEGIPTHALGVVYRSDQPTKPYMSDSVEGKKLGDYYYYTDWAFSGLSSGVGLSGIYGDNEEAYSQEMPVFNLINQGDSSLINTIELAQ
jgi:hypothetical protein